MFCSKVNCIVIWIIDVAGDPDEGDVRVDGAEGEKRE